MLSAESTRSLRGGGPAWLEMARRPSALVTDEIMMHGLSLGTPVPPDTSSAPPRPRGALLPAVLPAGGPAVKGCPPPSFRYPHGYVTADTLAPTP